MKNPAKNEGGQNKWSNGGLSRRRKQKWHDGEKTFTNARMAGGKAATSNTFSNSGSSEMISLYFGFAFFVIAFAVPVS